MMKYLTLRTGAAIVALMAPSIAHAMVVTEASNGDFSDSGAAPTALPGGTTGIEGEVTNNLPFGAFDNDDYVVFSGLSAGPLTIDYEITSFSGNVTIGFCEATTYTAACSADSGSLIENDNFVFGGVGALSGQFIINTFSGGDLTLWMNQLVLSGEGALWSYSIDLSSQSEVPVPGAAILLVTGLGGLAAAKRKKRAKRRA